MSVNAPTVPHTSVEDRLSRLESMQTVFATPTIPTTPAHVKIPTWLGILNAGTLLAVVLAIASFSYYLGGLNVTLTSNSANIEKLNTAVSGTSKESIASRLSVIETKLDALAAKPQRR